MVNQFAPFGLQDLYMREGNSPQYGLTKVQISSTDATPIFNGDLVQNLTGAPASGNFGEYITQGSSGLASNVNWYAGVFRGCEYLNTAVGRVVWSNYWPGSGAGADALAYVAREPDMQFIIQCSTNAVLGSSNIGQNFAVYPNGVAMTSSIGNTASGLSGIALASSISGSSGVGTGASAGAFRLKDFYSNYAPGIVLPAPGPTGGFGAGGPFVNGTDNTVAGQIVVVQLVNIGDNNLIGMSSAV